MRTVIPTDWKRCVTCKYWTGSRKPNAPFFTMIEHDSNEEGYCCIRFCQMNAELTCSKWEQQFKR